jgi:hypothetical protein
VDPVSLEDEAEAGFGGSGDEDVAKSSVARSSVLLAGDPQVEQKRPVAGMSVPQDEQVGIKLSRYSLPFRNGTQY